MFPDNIIALQFGLDSVMLIFMTPKTLKEDCGTPFCRVLQHSLRCTIFLAWLWQSTLLTERCM